MRKVLLALAVMASISLASYAQKGSHSNGWNRGAFPTKELNLSEEQLQKIESINKSYRSQIMALRSDSTLSKEDKNAKRKSLVEEKQTAMNLVLTSEQQSKLKEYTQKRSLNRYPVKGHGTQKELTKVRNLYRDLNLTMEQQNQIKDLNKDFRTKTKELALKHRTDINNILTPEQQIQLKAANKERVGRQGHSRRREGGSILDAETVSKLNGLKENFSKEKAAIEKSRIAPEEQTRRIKELNQKYRQDRRELIREAKEAKSKG